MADPGRILQTLEALRALGICPSVDDFGTGYSSPAYVHRLPVNEIKIDRSLIRPILADADSRAMVRAAVELVKNLRLGIVGIEDEETMSLPASLGCDAGQGYFIARPLAPPDLSASS